MKTKFSISCGEDETAWLRGAAEAWNLSRSAVVELAVRSYRHLIEGLAAVTETDRSRAVSAMESLQAGTIPPTVDLEALARTLKERAGVPP